MCPVTVYLQHYTQVAFYMLTQKCQVLLVSYVVALCIEFGDLVIVATTAYSTSSMFVVFCMFATCDVYM